MVCTVTGIAHDVMLTLLSLKFGVTGVLQSVAFSPPCIGWRGKEGAVYVCNHCRAWR